MNWIPAIAALLAIGWTVILVFAESIYDFDLRMYRIFGWTDLADHWETHKSWWLPFGRILTGACIIAAIAVLFASKTYS